MHKLTKASRLLLIATLLAGVALGLAPAPEVRAATHEIPNGDVTALIDAINDANGTGGPDTIELAEGGTYTLTAADNDTDGPNGLPSITSEITINGNNATIQRSSVGGTPEFRILHVGSSGDVTLNDLTIRQGQTPDGPSGSDGSDGGRAVHCGGGIFNAGQLTLNDSTVGNNRTGAGGAGGDSTTSDGGNGGDGADGGGICNIGNLTLTDSTVISNGTGSGGKGGDSSNDFAGDGGTGGSGGGIANSGTAILNSTTVQDNGTGEGGAGGSGRYGLGGRGGHGGGIHNSGTLLLNAATVRNNVVGFGGLGGDGGDGDGGFGGDGGGIHNSGDGTAELTDSTVHDNDAGSGGDGGMGTSSRGGGDGGDGGNGGGICNSGSLLLLNGSTVASNGAGSGHLGGDGAHGGHGGAGGDGGGLWNGLGDTILVDSSIEQNSAGSGGEGGFDVMSDGSGGSGGDGGSGGGICNAGGRVDVASSAICRNGTSTGGRGRDSGFYNGGSGGHGGHGGGVCNIGATAQMTLTNSTVSGNRTGDGNSGGAGGSSSEYGYGGDGGDGGHGGGIHNSDGTARLTNSTVSGNSTGDGDDGGDGGALGPGADGDGGHGGGVFNEAGTVELTHSTVTDNDTGQGGTSAPDGSGGGTHSTGAVTTTLKSSIVAENSASGNGPDCSGATTSRDYNLVGDDSGCTFAPDTHDQAGTGGSPIDPLLDALALNAPGNTETHALLAGSPALNQIPDGVNGCGTETTDDQRGIGRPQAGGCDIGAFEDAERGTIIVEKRTDPSGTPGTFDFTHDIESPFSFTLGDAETVDFTVWPRTYTVNEADATPDFYLADVTCSDDDSNGDAATGTATVILQSGETVTCTFTNSERGILVIQKQTDPPGGADFGFSVVTPPCDGDCEGLWFTLDDGQSRSFQRPGTFVVTEQATPGSYGLDDLTCVEDVESNSTVDVDSREATVVLDPGELVTCTFTNTLQSGTIIVKKQVEGGVCSSSYAFELPDLPAGTYPVTEEAPPTGDGPVAITCDDAGSPTPSTVDVEAGTATYELDPGETATCIFTNRSPRPTGGTVLPASHLRQGTRRIRSTLAPWIRPAILTCLAVLTVALVRRRGQPATRRPR
jgi:hypothetical protein